MTSRLSRWFWPGAREDARTIVCQDWLTSLGGAEQVLRQLVQHLDPDQVLTMVSTPRVLEELEMVELTTESIVSRLPYAQSSWGRYLPLMPLVWRLAPTANASLIVTSSYATVNAIALRPRGPSTKVVSYCHTPIRYAWLPEVEANRLGSIDGLVWKLVAPYARRLDRRCAQRVDLFIANGRETADRIRDFYGKEATIINPPADLSFFGTNPDVARTERLLAVGRLVAYKRFDLVIDVSKKTGIPLTIVGEGPEERRLQQLARATPGVTLAGRVSQQELRTLYQTSSALLFPQHEDFGIVPIEAQACGLPVFAYAAGGASETVQSQTAGALVSEQAADAFARAVRDAPKLTHDVEEALSRAVAEYSAHRFGEALADAISQLVEL